MKPSNDDDVMNKAFLDEKISERESHIHIKKNYNELKFLSIKQSVGEIHVQRVVKTTIQKLFKKRIF